MRFKVNVSGTVTIEHISPIEQFILSSFWASLQPSAPAMIANNLRKNPMWSSGAQAAWEARHAKT